MSARQEVRSSSDHRAHSQLASRIEACAMWLVGHASRAWPFLLFAIVLSVTWGALRQISTREFRTALRALDARWLVIAALATLANVTAMGLYDVIAFRHTRTRWTERWRYGAVAFAWSNFLTLGPLAGPAIRLWLYRQTVDQLSDLQVGVVSVAIAFTAGLVGWTLAVLVAMRADTTILTLSVVAFMLVFAGVWIARAVASRSARLTTSGNGGLAPVVQLAAVGWLDWLLAATAFTACIRATGTFAPSTTHVAESFFLGQVLGLVSFVPGGFGSSDMFWIAHVGLVRNQVAAALMAYRLIYYVIPWAAGSLVLLAWAARRMPRRLEVARRVVAALVGGGGVLIMMSSASPALHARLALVERFIPLPLVEAGQVTAALAGLVLLVLARGLLRGYRTAFRATLMLLAIAGVAAILKGFDWEEAVVLTGLAMAAWSQSALFQEPTLGDWLEGRDLVLAFAALALFLTFGTLSHRVSALTFERWMHVGYRLQATRFIRTAASMALAVTAGALYVLMRSPVGFKRLSDDEMARALSLHEQHGAHTNPLIVATGDKAVFFDDQRGFCLYRTIGPYLVVFSDPVVRTPAERGAFLDALFGFTAKLDRRLAFYQISPEWIPLLHDRGYDFFKLGEEAHVPLNRVTLEGHAGKMYRQILRRAERDGLRFKVLPPSQVERVLPELAAVSDDWLRAKGVVERQFSIGFFDEEYLRRYRCAIVEEARPGGRILAFANLLEGPNRIELSVDLMRYRSDGPSVMDFLMVSLLLQGQAAGYRRFNLGMAPLASVGEHRGAHVRERLARLFVQRGEPWYNFQGLRYYKEKFDPDWLPRYMAYQHGWEWPMAIVYVSALTAGGWRSMVRPAHQPKPIESSPPPQVVEA